MNTPSTLRDLLAQLSNEGYNLPNEYENAVAALGVDKREASSPWYVRFFVGLAAWVAAIFFVFFLFEVNALGTESAFFVGFIFCALAVGLNRLGPKNDFLEQLGLALSLTGQILMFIGMYAFWNNTITSTALGIVALEIILLWAYQARLHRVISTLIIPGALLLALYDSHFTAGAHVLIFALGAWIVAIFTAESHLLVAGLEDLAQPVRYGLALFFLGLLILPLFDYWNLNWWITAVLLLILLLFVAVQIAIDLELSLLQGAMPWLVAGCVFLLIPALRMPGILGAFTLLLLGFWRNDRPLLGLAASALVFYLGDYYYSLEWTLWVKSLALMATGAILFLIRYILLRFARGGVA
jgi:hypothetical protein